LFSYFFLLFHFISQDLLQRRSTTEAGDTVWQASALVGAARRGGLAVLDGVHRLTDDTLGVLGSLTCDREAVLFDGTRLIAAHRFDALARQLARETAGTDAGGVDAGILASAAATLEATHGLLRVHEAFRILALAEPPTGDRGRWLQSETLPMFAFEVLPRLSLPDKVKFVTEDMEAVKRAQTSSLPLRPSLSPPLARARAVLGELAVRLESVKAAADAEPLSLRQVKRIWDGLCADAARAAGSSNGCGTDGGGGGGNDCGSTTKDATNGWDIVRAEDELRRRVWLAQLADFAPKAIQDGLAAALDHAGAAATAASVVSSSPSSSSSSPSLPLSSATAPQPRTVERSTDGKRVRIGSTELPVRVPANPGLVPNPLFFDVPSHVGHLEAMAGSLLEPSGAPLLLIGDQGTGKNKLTDRLLQLLGLEREYMQLHRDSTVQSLTVVPTLTGGLLEWVDSPLVNAVKKGRVAVIDEVGACAPPPSPAPRGSFVSS